MAGTVSEIAEAQAEGKLKATYDDIKSSLRVPVVSPVFRSLSTHPDYLTMAWRALKPNVQTTWFERQADELRRYAVESVSGLATPPSGAPEIGSTLRIIHYVNPKLVLAVTALRIASTGMQPKLVELTRDDKRQVAPGVPAAAGEISTIELDQLSAPLQDLYLDMTSTLGLPLIGSEYLALAQWPDYLTSSWQTLKPLVSTPQYREAQRVITRFAEDVATALPYRIELSPHSLRHAGLSEGDLDGVQSTLGTFQRLLPGLTLNIALLTVGILGRDVAVESPFPMVDT